MRMLTRLLSAPVLALALAGTAHASTLVTPSVSVKSGDTLVCRIVNAGEETVTVDVDIVDFLGARLKGGPDVVEPGEVGIQVLVQTTTSAYCRFTGAFSKQRVRASVDVLSEGHTIAVAPAQ